MKKVTHTFLKVSGVFVGVVLANILAGSSNIRAITYSDASDIQFSFSSTLSIAISDADIIIGNLIPGQDDTSNAVDVVVNTNNLYGYTLTATVGDTNHDYRDLRHTNGTTNITSIAVNSDLSTLSGQSSSVWGYTVSTNGTTWSNYNGLPKYDDTTNTAELRATDGAAADSTTSFKIGAYAEEGQLAGDYSNVINFKVVSNGAPAATIADAITMQNVSSKAEGGCPAELPTGTAYQLTDSRDGEVYNVAKLADGNCWLLDNLRLDLTDATVQSKLTSSTTNASDITLNYLKNGGGTTLDQYATAGVANWDRGYSYSAPLINTTYKNTTSAGGYEAGKYGVYYNFCAATAGSYCYGDGTDEPGNPSGNAIEDVCPKGWRMPTGYIDGEYHALFVAYSSDVIVFENALRTPFSGLFDEDGFHDQSSEGYFWSSTDGSGLMGILDVSTPGQFGGVQTENSHNRGLGDPVRCILQ